MNWAEIIIREIIIKIKHLITLEEMLENISTSGYHPVIGSNKEFRRIIIKYWNE